MDTWAVPLACPPPLQMLRASAPVLELYRKRHRTGCPAGSMRDVGGCGSTGKYLGGMDGARSFERGTYSRGRASQGSCTPVLAGRLAGGAMTALAATPK